MMKAGVNKIYGWDKIEIDGVENKDIGRELLVSDVGDPPPKYLIDSIREKGIETPITIKKISGVPFIVKGRSREKAARWLKENEGLDILVPTMVLAKGTSLAEMMSSVLSENLARKKVKPENLIEDIAHYIRFNGEDEQAMDLLYKETQLDKRRVEKLMAVRASPVAYKALKEKKVDVQAAIALAEMPEHKQSQALTEMIAEAKASGAEKPTTEQARAKKMGRSAKPQFKKAKRMYDLMRLNAGDNKFDEAILDLMGWSLGLVSEDKLHPELKKYWDMAKDSKATKAAVREAKKAAKAAKKVTKATKKTKSKK